MSFNKGVETVQFVKGVVATLEFFLFISVFGQDQFAIKFYMV